MSKLQITIIRIISKSKVIINTTTNINIAINTNSNNTTNNDVIKEIIKPNDYETKMAIRQAESYYR